MTDKNNNSSVGADAADNSNGNTQLENDDASAVQLLQEVSWKCILPYLNERELATFNLAQWRDRFLDGSIQLVPSKCVIDDAWKILDDRRGQYSSKHISGETPMVRGLRWARVSTFAEGMERAYAEKKTPLQGYPTDSNIVVEYNQLYGKLEDALQRNCEEPDKEMREHFFMRLAYKQDDGTPKVVWEGFFHQLVSSATEGLKTKPRAIVLDGEALQLGSSNAAFLLFFRFLSCGHVTNQDMYDHPPWWKEIVPLTGITMTEDGKVAWPVADRVAFADSFLITIVSHQHNWTQNTNENRLILTTNGCRAEEQSSDNLELVFTAKNDSSSDYNIEATICPDDELGLSFCVFAYLPN